MLDYVSMIAVSLIIQKKRSGTATTLGFRLGVIFF